LTVPQFAGNSAANDASATLNEISAKSQTDAKYDTPGSPKMKIFD